MTDTSAAPTRAILQSTLDRLTSDTAMLADGIRQRQEMVAKLNAEIEQHKGAHAYNAQIATMVRTQLESLAVPASPTPAGS